MLAPEERVFVDLSQPPALPEEAITAAIAVMRSGWLHRYGESLGDGSEVALLEEEFAELLGARFCVAMNSCGSTMFIALLATGLKPGNGVLMNAFTLAPVPGAIAHAGGVHHLVETSRDLVIDLADLEAKAAATGAKHLILSHMRGHIADLSAVTAIAETHGLTMIEDCAHTMGASWAGQPTGRFGRVGCFSLQSYKHVNAGEGGLLVTDDEDVAAQAILYSGSYMLYGQHRRRPSEAVFARWKGKIPNYSLRMSNLVAAIARPQLALLPERAREWNARYDLLATELARVPGFSLPKRPQMEAYAQSSLQFVVEGLADASFAQFLASCRERGVYLKWFGAEQPAGYTSLAGHWEYLREPVTPPKTKAILARLCDMRLPLDLPLATCSVIARIIAEEYTNQRALTPNRP